ncbi:hypothetical protein [Vibrio sp. WZ-1]|uniref:hypothetical protein n=1 Tax=Vibrio sp. WZ-1 TaxID=3454501 RepID=UPI003F864118
MRYQVEISKENQLLFKVDIDNINQDKCETRYLKSTEKRIELLAAIPVFKSLGER